MCKRRSGLCSKVRKNAVLIPIVQYHVKCTEELVPYSLCSEVEFEKTTVDLSPARAPKTT